MSIEIRVATDSDLEKWDDYVDRSPQGTLFHERAALDLQADYADATVHRLIGFKGQEPVGLFPVFELRRGFVTTAFSPPPDLRVPYLGPAFLNMAKLKQRKRERRRQRFMDACLDWIEAELAPKYEHVRTGPGLGDPRPFKWNDYDLTPQFTYAVDLSGDADDLLSSFSSDARKNVTKTPDEDYRVEDGGPPEIRDILEQVSNRYESQGIGFHLSAEFVVDLHERAEHGRVRPYALTVDGEFLGGILAVEHGDTVARWQGGVRTDADVDLPINDLLDWAVIEDGLDRGLSTYDLVGAETQRINEYKAKFNPSLRPYFSVERGKWGLRNLAHAYSSVK